MLTHLRFARRPMAPKVPTAFCVCPDGNEYPVAAARADSTIVKRRDADGFQKP